MYMFAEKVVMFQLCKEKCEFKKNSKAYFGAVLIHTLFLC